MGVLKVGDSYGGDIVAYILQDNGDDPDDPGYVAGEHHGLIAATADAKSTMPWSNITSTLVGTTGTALGDGQANTTLIVNQIVDTIHCTSGAAYYCDNLTEGGHNDWFLPSKDELNKLYINKDVIGSFADDADDCYWSSSEYDAGFAWYQDFSNGSQDHAHKYSTGWVRAVRVF